MHPALWLALWLAADGISLYQARQFPQAEQALRRTLAANPKDTQSRLYLVRTLVELDRFPEAVEELDRALAAQDPETRFQAGQILRDLAERRLAALERISPDSAAVRELSARQAELEGRLADALREYRAAMAKEPQRPGSHYGAGNLLWRMRELDAAASELNAELALNPNHGMANLRLGQILVARDELEQALPFLERAVAALPESWDAHREYGKALRKAGRRAEARREWEAVAIARPEDDQVHFLLGGLYREMGETVRSKSELEKHRQILERRRLLAEKR